LAQAAIESCRRRFGKPIFRILLEPRLTRHGYNVRNIADESRLKPADVRLFLQGRLDPTRTRELIEQRLIAGLPV